MSYIERLKEVDQLKNKIETHGKLSNSVLKKINYRFRLDWNYYSNKMEGNTLTMQETRSIMIGNITVDDKPLKDIYEMQGHDKAISEILRIGKGELNISESRIKNMHRAIMHEDDKEKADQVGQWKKADNYVLNYRDERHDYTPASEVADAMHDLVNWYCAEKEKIEEKKKDALHPVIHALEFHIRYLSIHPFYDGNGRTARMLMNLILTAYGYPPIVIKTEDKEVYYRYLADIQTYGGSSDLYYEHLLKMLSQSLNLVLDAIEGKDIVQPDDIDKRLELLEKELGGIDPNQELQKNFGKEVLYEIYDGWFTDLVKQVIPVIQKFNKFFIETQHQIRLYDWVSFTDESAEEILVTLRDRLDKNDTRIDYHNSQIEISSNFINFKKGGVNAFSCYYRIQIKFDRTKYEVLVDEFNGSSNETKQFKQGLLHIPLSQKEIERLATNFGESIFNHIDHKTKELGLRK